MPLPQTLFHQNLTVGGSAAVAAANPAVLDSKGGPADLLLIGKAVLVLHPHDKADDVPLFESAQRTLPGVGVLGVV